MDETTTGHTEPYEGRGKAFCRSDLLCLALSILFVAVNTLLPYLLLRHELRIRFDAVMFAGMALVGYGLGRLIAPHNLILAVFRGNEFNLGVWLLCLGIAPSFFRFHVAQPWLTLTQVMSWSGIALVAFGHGRELSYRQAAGRT